MKTNTTHNMFISEQYGWLTEVSGEFFDQILIDVGGGDFHAAHMNGDVSWLHDNDLMLMGL